MKRWYFKALLAISGLTIILGYTSVYIFPPVHAQASLQASPQPSTKVSSSGSNQSGDSQNWSTALIAALVSTNATLAIALGSGFAWLFRQYKEQSKKNEENVEKQHGKNLILKDYEIRLITIELEDLKKKNKQNIQNSKQDFEFRISECCTDLDKKLERIHQKLPDKRIEKSKEYKKWSEKIAEICQKINNKVSENLKDSLKEDVLNFRHARKRTEEELNDLRGVSSFIPNMEIYQKYIRQLLVQAVRLDQQKTTDDDILRMLIDGFHEVEKHEQKEKLAMSQQGLKEFFSTPER